MAAADEANVSLTLDIAQVKAELAKLPGEGGKQAQKLVDGIEKEYKRLERAAKKAAESQKKDADAGYKKMADGAKQAFTAIGGQAGAMAGQVENAVKSIGSLAAGIGPVGLGAIGATVAVGGLATGVLKLARTADEAADRLRDAGLGDLITEEQNRRLALYDAGLKELQKDFDVLKVSAGAEAAGNIGDVAFALDHVYDAVSDIVPDAPKLTQAVDGWRGVFGPFTILLGQALDHLHEVNHEVGLDFVESNNKAGLATQELAEEQEYLSKIIPIGTGKTKERTAAVKEAKSADEDWLEGLGSVEQLEKDLAAARAKAANAQIDGIAASREQREEADLLVGSLNEMVDAVTDFEERWKQFAENQDGMATFFAKQKEAAEEWRESTAAEAFGFAADMGEAAVQVADAITSALNDANQREIDALEDRANRQIENAERDADNWRKNQEQRIADELEAGEISEKEAKRRRDDIAAEYEDRKSAADDQANDERRRAKQLFKQQQDLAKAMVVVHVAEGLLMSIATMGPPIPPNFVGMAGAASVVAAGITEGAAIANAEPPSFERGGMVGDRAAGLPDHIMIAASRFEGILDSQGVDTAGGPEGVARLNDGVGIGGAPVVQVVLGRRVIAEVLADATGRGTPDPRRGRRDPNRGGR